MGKPRTNVERDQPDSFQGIILWSGTASWMMAPQAIQTERQTPEIQSARLSRRFAVSDRRPCGSNTGGAAREERWSTGCNGGLAAARSNGLASCAFLSKCTTPSYGEALGLFRS